MLELRQHDETCDSWSAGPQRQRKELETERAQRREQENQLRIELATLKAHMTTRGN